MLRQAQHERKIESWVVRFNTNGKGNARQLSSPVRPESRRRVSGSGGRTVVVEHAGLRSCFDKLSTNGREGHGQFGSARMVRETHVSYPLPFALSRVEGYTAVVAACLFVDRIIPFVLSLSKHEWNIRPPDGYCSSGNGGMWRWAHSAMSCVSSRSTLSSTLRSARS